MHTATMKKFLKILLVSTMVFAVVLTCGGLIAFQSITKNAVFDNTLMPKNEITTVFSDINGNNVEGFKNSFAQYFELPDNLKNAVVAVEDKRFYKHKGVDTIRIFGAIRNNLKGGSLEGASTITQQLVKNTHLTQEKSIKRKLNEIKIAKQLEKEYSKDDILTSYLNVSYFGGGLYGVKSAAKGIFNKNLSSLTLSECAVLAGILKNPSKYSPVASVENATKRRNVVLSLMKNQNLITDAEYNSAKNEKISVDLNAIYSNTQSYVESASFEAAGILNVSVGGVLSGGYKIETFLNPDYQACLTEVLGNPNFYVLNKNGVRADGLSIIVDNKNMGVSAYFSTKKRNIYDFYRPFGSTAKPVVIYAPAIRENVVSPATPVLDMKTDFNGYMPKNYSEHYLGWTDVRAAIMTSSNVVAVKTYNALGFKNVQSFANSVGINISDFDENATVALGNFSKNNMLSLVGAYATFANSGIYNKPSFINRIYDKSGKIVYEKSLEQNAVLSPADAYIMTDVLVDTAKYGTAKGLNNLDFQVAAKTGTVGGADGNSDAYNVAYTSSHTYLLWHGNASGAKNNDMSLDETGGSYVTRSMREVLKYVESGKSAAFTIPSDVYRVDIDAYAQKNKQKVLLATKNTPKTYLKSEVFKRNNLPENYSTCFDGFSVEEIECSVSDGIVNVKIAAEPYLYYDVFRFDGERETLVKQYENGNDKLSFYDVVYNKKLVKYYIKPYFYNQYGIKIVGNVHETDWFLLNNDINIDDFSNY